MCARLRRRRQRRHGSPLAIESLELRVLLHGAEISGSVFLDGNANGQRDTGEVGVPGAVVRLSPVDSGSSSDDLLVLTDDDGNYAFHQLDPGAYQLSARSIAALDSSAAGPRRVTVEGEQVQDNNNFAAGKLRSEHVGVRWLLASASPAALLREAVAGSEEAAGNAALADAIRTRGAVPPNLDGDSGGDDGGGDGNSGVFGPVTPGAFDAAELLGTRTDLVPGAPPISRDHVSSAVDYSGFSNPPTYGPHHAPDPDADGTLVTPRPTGIYETEQPDEDLVHNLEHGHVWISYNPSLIRATDLQALRQLVADGGSDSGVILTPRSENTEAIALASWAHLETSARFNAARTRRFIETNRGHAPEGFVPSGQKNPAGGEETNDGLQHRLSPNRAFGPVTPGPVNSPELRGIRTDTVPGAPIVSGEHVTTAVDYSSFSNPPSYGPHHAFLVGDNGGAITPRPTGVYLTEQPDEDLVHNLEHGHVWISYNPALLSPADVTALRNLVEAGGTDAGVILTPRSKNTEAIALTSWTHQQTLDSFVAETVRDFVVTNRGHGPEGFLSAGQKTTASETLDDGVPHSP